VLGIRNLRGILSDQSRSKQSVGIRNVWIEIEHCGVPAQRRVRHAENLFPCRFGRTGSGAICIARPHLRKAAPVPARGLQIAQHRRRCPGTAPAGTPICSGNSISSEDFLRPRPTPCRDYKCARDQHRTGYLSRDHLRRPAYQYMKLNLSRYAVFACCAWSPSIWKLTVTPYQSAGTANGADVLLRFAVTPFSEIDS
jgi:hypothetical protein